MDRRLAKLSSLARDFFSSFPERESMPLDGLSEEERTAFSERVQTLAEAVAAAAADEAPPPSGDAADAADPRLRTLTRLAAQLSQDASARELAAARRAADYTQLTGALALISAAEHFARHPHGRAVAAELLLQGGGGGGGALERWRQEHVRRRLVAAGFVRATAPLAEVVVAAPEAVKGREGQDDGGDSSSAAAAPSLLLRPFESQCVTARRALLPAGGALPLPALRRRLRAVGHGCLDGILSPPQGGWVPRRRRPEEEKKEGEGQRGGNKEAGAVVLVGDAVPWMVAGGGGATAAAPPTPPPLDVAFVGFACPAAAARAAADGLLGAVAHWRARHQAPWPGVAEEGGEEERAEDEGGDEPVASLGAGGCLTLRLPERGGAEAVVVRMLPAGGEPSSSSSSPPPPPLLALERLLLQGGGVFGSSGSSVVGCSPCPAMAFDGEAVWALPRASDALREGGLVLEARAGAPGAGGGDASWAERRAAELRRAAERGWQARVPVPADDNDDGGGEGAREARALEAACVADAAAAAAASAGPGGADEDGGAAAARSWPYREFVRAGPHGATALPGGLLEALVEAWEACARRPQPRGPYELVAFEEAA